MIPCNKPSVTVKYLQSYKNCGDPEVVNPQMRIEINQLIRDAVSKNAVYLSCSTEVNSTAQCRA